MSPMAFNPLNTGTAAAGGKGGTMGGFGAVGGGGKGGAQNQGATQDQGATPAVTNPSINMAPVQPPQMPSAAPAANPMGPNAFETGLGSMNNAMEFFSGALGGNQGISDMISGLNSGGSFNGVLGAGGNFNLPNVSAPSQDMYDYNPAQVNAQGYQAAQLADKDIDAYLNPYTQNVIDNTMADLGRARDDAMNASGVAATRGGAFGGDRHAILESQNNADYMRQAASTSAQLRNQGFQNAQAAAMNDISAMNQQRGYNAGAENAARMANASSANDRSQFVGNLNSANDMAAQQANLQAATQMGVAGTNANASLQAARMSQMGQNQRTALEAALRQQGMQYDAANQLYNMGGDRWQMGQDALSAMSDVGQRIDDTNQTLIDQQRSEFERLTGAPQDQYSQMLAALSSLSGGGTTTSSYNPGMFDYLKAGTSLFGLGK